jgi:hypothetical protein
VADGGRAAGRARASHVREKPVAGRLKLKLKLKLKLESESELESELELELEGGEGGKVVF